MYGIVLIDLIPMALIIPSELITQISQPVYNKGIFPKRAVRDDFISARYLPPRGGGGAAAVTDWRNRSAENLREKLG